MFVHSPQSILMVDDNEPLRYALSRLLRAYVVHQAATSTEALRFAKARPVHLYIVDYRLPDMNGLELCRRIRAFDRNTPLMMLSGDAVGASAREAGAQLFLRKPIDDDAIIQEVMLLLRQQLLQDETARIEEQRAIGEELARRITREDHLTVERRRLMEDLNRDVSDARKLLDSLHALRAHAFRRYTAAGGSRRGFLNHWPEVAAPLKVIK